MTSTPLFGPTSTNSRFLQPRFWLARGSCIYQGQPRVLEADGARPRRHRHIIGAADHPNGDGYGADERPPCSRHRTQRPSRLSFLRPGRPPAPVKRHHMRQGPGPAPHEDGGLAGQVVQRGRTGTRQPPTSMAAGPRRAARAVHGPDPDRLSSLAGSGGRAPCRGGAQQDFLDIVPARRRTIGPARSPWRLADRGDWRAEDTEPCASPEQAPGHRRAFSVVTILAVRLHRLHLHQMTAVDAGTTRRLHRYQSGFEDRTSMPSPPARATVVIPPESHPSAPSTSPNAATVDAPSTPRPRGFPPSQAAGEGIGPASPASRRPARWAPCAPHHPDVLHLLAQRLDVSRPPGSGRSGHRSAHIPTAAEDLCPAWQRHQLERPVHIIWGSPSNSRPCSPSKTACRRQAIAVDHLVMAPSA